jgi:phosphate transport system substrate-binding protein
MKNTLRGKLVVAIATAGLLSTMAVTVASATGSANGDLTFSAADNANSFAPAMGGSSFDEPFFNSAIPDFMSAANRISGANAPSSIPLYSPTGSSAGKKGVISGTNVVGASDVPLGTVVNGNNLDSSLLTNADAAHTLNSYVQIPVVLGGVGLMYNLPTLKAKFPKTTVILNAAVLASIYDGAITKWNDAAICHLNRTIVYKHYRWVTVKRNGKKVRIHRLISTTCAMPNIPVVPVYRADGSGTSFIFMDYLNKSVGASFKGSSGEVFPGTTFNQGEVPTNALGGQKNAGVANDVEQTVGAIGYVEYAYILLQHTLPSAKILNAAGKAMSLNPTTISADAAAFVSTPPAEGGNGVVTNFSIVNGAGAGAYPIAGYSWAMVRQDWSGLGSFGGVTASLNSEKLVAKFLDWSILGGNAGQAVAAQNGYVPLPSYVTALAQKQIALMTYNGAPLGLK